MSFNIPSFKKSLKINAVLFDLDGTLLDTAPDLAAALNAVLLSQRAQPLPLTNICPTISEGATGLLKLGLKIKDKDAKFPDLRKQFIKYYNEHICELTQLFPHIDTVIHYLLYHNLSWGIVTNKPTALTTKLINHFPLLKTAKCIISGDTLKYSKPHPQPLLHACKCIACIPKNTVYIGDAKQDIEAANAAGMYSLVALYGYIPSIKEAKSWKANDMIDTPLAIIDWLKLQNITP
ncbi:MAG: phosphoglycolate phosphatase [Rickettsiella sp.]|nr:phosphoglycolate phosphatase [Rickettsiella sp.]